MSTTDVERALFHLKTQLWMIVDVLDQVPAPHLVLTRICGIDEATTKLDRELMPHSVAQRLGDIVVGRVNQGEHRLFCGVVEGAPPTSRRVPARTA